MARNADYRWTKPKMLDFLRCLASSGSVAVAARQVGMSRQSAYNLRKRLGQDFAHVWDSAVLLSRRARVEQVDASGAS